MTGLRMYGERVRGFRSGMLIAGAAALTAGCAGCAGGGGERASAQQSRAVNPDVREPVEVRRAEEKMPVALIGGQPVGWSDLLPRLAEAGGGGVLEEVVLDRMVSGEAARSGITISEEDVRRERELLARAMSQASGAGPDEVSLMMERVLRARGLGEQRFRALLERNAKLRALVRGDVQITEEDIARAREARYGPKYRVRIIVTPTQEQAAEALRRVKPAPESGRDTQPFAEVAAELSLDPSRERGGLLEPLSTADSSYPAALRRTVASLKTGEISPVIALDAGYGVVKLEEVLPGRTPTAEEEASLAEEVRTVQERLLMDRMAGRLLSEAQVTVFDPSLHWSWESRRPPDPTSLPGGR